MNNADDTPAGEGYSPFAGFDEWRQIGVDSQRWDALLSRSKVSGGDAEMLARAQDVAKRAAAIESGAIEGLYPVDRGFTITVATQSAYWAAAYEKTEARVRRLIESQIAGYDATIDFATGREPLVAAWIRRLHEIICEGQETYTVHLEDGHTEQRPLVLGQYKALPNNVITSGGKVHWYAPPDMVVAEMERLCDEMKRPEFEAAHAVLQAAFAHYAFVAIHPFTDGNGRVARAIGSVFTYRAASIPLLILADHKSEYFAALEKADQTDHVPFVNFLYARCEDAIELVEQSMRSAKAVPPEEAKKRLQAYTRLAADLRMKTLMRQAIARFRQYRKDLVSNWTGYWSRPFLPMRSSLPRAAPLAVTRHPKDIGGPLPAAAT